MNEYDLYLMHKEQILEKKLNKATERALKLFDKWNDVTGCFGKDTSYYYEVQACIEDAVKCGFQSALDKYEELKSEKE